MQFTTQIPIPKSSTPIDYNSKIVSLGSCFAENMGAKFHYFKFQNNTNPFGIIFNPVSIERLIDRVVNDQIFKVEDIFYYNEQWHCYEVHSDLSDSNNEILLQNLNQFLIEAKKQLIGATHIIITYGTSWVYRNIKSDSIVANCHKVPQNQFAKELLSAETIEKSIQNTLDVIKKLNPNCTIIFTISPVRHLKDGFVENQVSKANLITALFRSLEVHPSGAEGDYFPSYEIMMDELRDYRFYAPDMIHPSQVAIDYIWQRFKETTISENAYENMGAVESIQRSLQHRPFNPNSESHQKFEINLKEKIANLVAQYSFMKF